MYYLFVNGTTTGPFAEAEIQERWARGAIPGEALCCRAGAAAWVPFREVFELTKEGQVRAGTGGAAAPPSLPPAVLAAAENFRGAAFADQPAAGAAGQAGGLTLAPAQTIPRLLAYIIDYTIIMGIAGTVPALLGYTVDPGSTVGFVLILIAGAVFRDALPGGRSLGRLITGLRLVDAGRHTTATFAQGLRHNGLQILLLMLPWLPLGLLSLVGTREIPILEYSLAVLIMGYYLAIVGSASNPTGQGYWDRWARTCVVGRS